MVSSDDFVEFSKDTVFLHRRQGHAVKIKIQLKGKICESQIALVDVAGDDLLRASQPLVAPGFCR